MGVTCFTLGLYRENMKKIFLPENSGWILPKTWQYDPYMVLLINCLNGFGL